MLPLPDAVDHHIVLNVVPDLCYRYHTDPSGTFVRYEAKAIGSGSEAAQSELQDKWHKVPSYPLSSYGSNSDRELFTANDTKGSPNSDVARSEASDGGEARSTQRTISTGEQLPYFLTSYPLTAPFQCAGDTRERVRDSR